MNSRMVVGAAIHYWMVLGAPGHVQFLGASLHHRKVFGALVHYCKVLGSPCSALL